MLWAQLARTVTPLEGRSSTPDHRPSPVPGVGEDERCPPPLRSSQIPSGKVLRKAAPPIGGATAAHGAPATATPVAPGLDSHWERRLRRAASTPELTLDLHGHTLEQAYHRLDRGLAQAKAMGARLVLVIAGKPRPSDAADRGTSRGAIRAKLPDWLAAGPHAADIAAIRPAHRRHGGEGALYVVLKRRR